MPDHDILCELFRKEARVALEDGDYGKKAVTLSEPKCDDHKGYSVVIDYRFVSIRDIAINKKPTRISPLDGLHDSPERMLKINSPHHLQFKQLVGAV